MPTTARRREKQSARKLTFTQESSAPPFTQGSSTLNVIHGHGADEAGSSTPERVLNFEVPKVARGSSQFFIGWVPGRGNDRNATVTVAVEW